MELTDLLGKKPSEMSDDELHAQLHRLRTSRVKDGRITGQTKPARKRRATKEALLKSGKYTEAQVEAVLDDLEKTHANEQETREAPEVPELKPGEVYIP